MRRARPFCPPEREQDAGGRASYRERRGQPPTLGTVRGRTRRFPQADRDPQTSNAQQELRKRHGQVYFCAHHIIGWPKRGEADTRSRVSPICSAECDGRRMSSSPSVILETARFLGVFFFRRTSAIFLLSRSGKSDLPSVNYAGQFRPTYTESRVFAFFCTLGSASTRPRRTRTCGSAAAANCQLPWRCWGEISQLCPRQQP